VRQPARTVYVIDTSSLAYCQRSFGARSSRVAFYHEVWDLLDRLAADGRLVAPHVVMLEITKNKDNIGLWAARHSAIFRPKGEYAARVVEILREPGQRLVKGDKPRGSEESDPWVIALAEELTAAAPTLFDPPTNGVVVSEEAATGGIREICLRRGGRHMDFTEMLLAEGLSFGAALPT
jgi:Domain of unknown function (DUF4411)